MWPALIFVTYYSFATGIEFRESSMMIGPKCTATAKAGQYGLCSCNQEDNIAYTGMVFNVTLGFNQLENSQADDDKSKIYALLIGDTVVVNKVLCFDSTSHIH